jgi:Icc-related predicted phosphoesterase
MKKVLMLFIVLLGIAFILSGCSDNAANEIKIGIVSDIHGNPDAEKLKGADFILIAGDYANVTLDIEPYAKLGIPVYVIPGNHETKEDYYNEIEDMHERYLPVIDIHGKAVDLPGFNIVGLGGYYDKDYIVENGFLLNDSDYENAREMLFSFMSQDEPIIFLTHSPPFSDTKMDYVPNVGNVGDKKIADLMNDNQLSNIINVCGHIHEGKGISAEYKSGYSINSATITELITIKK